MSKSGDKKYILAIDHGTSGPKTAIVSVYGDVIDWVFKGVPKFLAETDEEKGKAENMLPTLVVGKAVNVGHL